MSTHTPTGDGVATGDGVSAVPPWLPGEAALTRLANDLFAALPGDRAATVLPGDLPTTAPPGDQAATVLPGKASATGLQGTVPPGGAWAPALPDDAPATALRGDLPAPALGDFVHRRHVICGIDAPRCCRRSALDLDLRITLAYEPKPDSLPSR